MPFIHFKGVGGHLSPAQKTALISRLTDAVVDVYGEGIRQATWVAIEEVPPGAWGAAGDPITEADVRRLVEND